MSLAQRRLTATGLSVMAATWLTLSVTASAGSFALSKYLPWLGAAALAERIVGALNSWAGFAVAVAIAAAYGLSWTVILIKGVLQKVGLRFAIQYATML